MSQFTAGTTSQESLYGLSRARLEALLEFNLTLRNRQAQAIRDYDPADKKVDLITMKGLWFILKLRIAHIETAIKYLEENNFDVVPTPSGAKAADEDVGFWPPEDEVVLDTHRSYHVFDNPSEDAAQHSPPTTTMPADLQKGETHVSLDNIIIFFDPHVIQYNRHILQYDVDVGTDDEDEIPELVDLEEDPQPCCRHCPTYHPLTTIRAKL
ncbi:hypothetical protein C8R44DRAFT_866701 [Mycena epipterygia]|nr:hypothetical protein C8R44DRAFT_866701 [Mycena epipterygia]